VSEPILKKKLKKTTIYNEDIKNLFGHIPCKSRSHGNADKKWVSDRLKHGCSGYFIICLPTFMNARLAINVSVLIGVQAALVIIGLHVFKATGFPRRARPDRRCARRARHRLTQTVKRAARLRFQS